MGLAFWLAPSDSEARSSIAAAIEHLSKNNSEHSASVPFSPHATLLSGVESTSIESTWKIGIDSLREWKQNGGLAAAVSTLNVPLSDVITNGKYFQCVLIALQKTQALLSMNDCICRALGKQDSPPYLPHVSLLYSPMSAEHAKTIINQMEQDGIFRRSPSFSYQGITSIDFNSVELWDCTGPVQDWKCLRAISLAEL